MDSLPGRPHECKFALLALTKARMDVPDAGLALRDGTYVLMRFPIELSSKWHSWLGIESSQINGANLVLVRTAETGFRPEALPISDGTNWELAKHLDNLFSMLRLLGTLEYESAFLVMGYVLQDRAVCQQVSKLARFEITRGCLGGRAPQTLWNPPSRCSSAASLEHGTG